MCFGPGLTDERKELTIRGDARIVRRHETYQREQIGMPQGKAVED
jgi:hypothetical protein